MEIVIVIIYFNVEGVDDNYFGWVDDVCYVWVYFGIEVFKFDFYDGWLCFFVVGKYDFE